MIKLRKTKHRSPSLNLSGCCKVQCRISHFLSSSKQMPKISHRSLNIAKNKTINLQNSLTFNESQIIKPN